MKIAWWFWAAWFLVGALRAFVVFQRSPRESKLLQDLLAGLIYLAAAFAIIAYVFDLPIQGLLATSGVVATKSIGHRDCAGSGRGWMTCATAATIGADRAATWR